MKYALFSKESLQKRMEILKEIPNPNEEWYPTVGDIELFIHDSPADYIDFLLWLSVLEQDFTQDEKDTKEYVKKLIKSTIRICTEEEMKNIKELRMKTRRKGIS